MQVPFLSSLTRTASSPNSAAQNVETLYTRANTAATGHEASTWNMACATEELNFKLCLILINLSLKEKKPYVAIDYHCGQCGSMNKITLVGMTFNICSAQCLDTWQEFTCLHQGNYGGMVGVHRGHPELLQTPSSTKDPYCPPVIVRLPAFSSLWAYQATGFSNISKGESRYHSSGRALD